jgi:SAM-dependent MidA family methyltransferase
MSTLRPDETLRRRIEAQGSITVAEYMALANAHYYATRDPLGAGGDFTTSPEISQMFGELVGVCLADTWQGSGRLPGGHYVELGPGRGSLAYDALRAMRSAGLEPDVHLVETSPVLRERQKERLGNAAWHDAVESLPRTGPLLVVANEFFDALPIHQFASDGRELVVQFEGGRFVRRGTAHRETSPASSAVMAEIASRLVRQGGVAIIADYGHDGTGIGDTLQAVSRHAYADPWEDPGSRDLSAHVDFGALSRAALQAGALVFGPRSQGAWLESMGIGLRAASLARGSPERTEEIEAGRHRLTAPDAMGRLFRVMAAAAPSWAQPAGL